jgi:cardiolipin synthase
MDSDNLKKRVGHLTLANQLTFLRLVAVPFFILAILSARFGVALTIFIAAGVTDLLDGLIARVFRQRTALGAFLDPAADKLLLTAAFVLLTKYPNLFQSIPMTNRIPIGLTILVISRDVLIVAISMMLNFAYGQTQFKPSIWGKVTTGTELVTTGIILLMNHLEKRHPIVPFAIGTTLALILISAFTTCGGRCAMCARRARSGRTRERRARVRPRPGVASGPSSSTLSLRNVASFSATTTGRARLLATAPLVVASDLEKEHAAVAEAAEHLLKSAA